MIVARICDERGLPLAASGSIKIANYEGTADGWFPIESFSFGLHKAEESKDPSAKGAAHPVPAKGGSSAPAPAPGGGKGAAGKSGHAELTITKPIDTATVSLMMLVMREKSMKKGLGKNSTPLNADIHTLSSVSLEKQQKDRFLYASLLIHLEAVNVEGWDINGSGDARPTENVKLRYDRAAMVYVSTSDGLTFHAVGPSGWDQTKDKDFDWIDPKMNKYLAPGCKCPGW